MMYTLGHSAPYADRFTYMDHTPWFGSSFGFLGGLFGLFVTIAVIALVVIGVVALVRHSRKTHAATAVPAIATGVAQDAAAVTEDAALVIARERLARGDIDPDQYRAIAEALSS